MKRHEKNIDKKDLEKLSKKFFENAEISFPTSKDEAWKAVEAKMSETTRETPKPIRLDSRILLLAASLVFLIAALAFLRYYARSFSSNLQAINIVLPDSSMVELGPESELSYHPFWWRFERNLRFEGTADFSVSHGKKFRVSSNTGITEVLGTTFAIQSGKEMYIVACYSGSVRVTDPQSEVSAVLSANEKAELKSPGVFDIQLIKKEAQEDDNTREYLTFRQRPLTEVLDLLEGEFGVIIDLSQTLDLIYTGNFIKGMSIEEILSAICLPLELEYVQLSENKYRIQKSITRKD